MPKEPQIGDWRAFQEELRQQTSPFAAPGTEGRTIVSDVTPAPDIKYDRGYTPEIKDVNQLRQGNQSAWDVTKNAVTKGVAGATLELGEGVGYIGKGLYEVVDELWDTEEPGFIEMQNAVSTAFRNGKQEVFKNNPVYSDEADQFFNPFNPMSWAIHSESVASTLSLLIPGTIAAKVGAGAAVKIGGKVAAKAGQHLSKKAVKAMATIGGGVSGTLASRPVENLLEGYQTYEETLIGRLQDQGYSHDVAEEQAHWLLANPEQALDSPFAEDFMKAAENATRTAQWNWLAAIPDMLQYGLLIGGVKGFKTAVPATTGTKLNKLHKAGAKTWNAIHEVVPQAVSEGVEEGYQYVVQKEAMRGKDMWKGDLGERMGEYLAEEDFWSSVVMGASMGVGFHAIGSLVDKIGGRTRHKFEKWTLAQFFNDQRSMTNNENGSWAATINGAFKAGGSVESIATALESRIAEYEAKKDENGTERTANPKAKFAAEVLRTLAPLEEELRKAGFSDEQVAIRMEQELLHSLQGLSIENLGSSPDARADDAIKTKKLKSEKKDAYLLRLRKAAIQTFLKENATSRAKATPGVEAYLTKLEAELAEIKNEELDGTITPQDKLIEQDYISLFDQELRQARSTDELAALRTPEEAQTVVDKREEQIAQARKEQSEKDAGEASTAPDAETMEQKKADAIENGMPDTELDTLIHKSAPALENDILTMMADPEVDHNAKADALNAFYASNPQAASRDKEALGKLLGDPDKFFDTLIFDEDHQLPGDAIMQAFMESDENAKAILTYFSGSANETAEDANFDNSPEPSDEYDASEDDVIMEVGSEPTGVPGQEPVDLDNIPGVNFEALLYDRHPVTLAHEADPWNKDGTPKSFITENQFPIDVDKLNDPTFQPTGWKVIYKVWPQPNQNANAGNFKVPLFAVDPKTGDEIFIGYLPRSSYNKNKKLSPLRAKAWSEFQQHNSTEPLTLSFTSKVKEKYAGKIWLNEADNEKTKAQSFHPIEEIMKGYEFYLITAIGNGRTASIHGRKELPKEVRDKLNMSADDMANSEKGKGIGKIWTLVQMANGLWHGTRLKTLKVKDAPQVHAQITEIIDRIYDFTNVEGQQAALDELAAIVYFNNGKSNLQFKLNPKKHGLIDRKTKSTTFPSKETLAEALMEELFFIDASQLNTGTYNLDNAYKFDNSNLNKGPKVHSTTFEIEVASVDVPAGEDEQHQAVTPDEVIETLTTASLFEEEPTEVKEDKRQKELDDAIAEADAEVAALRESDGSVSKENEAAFKEALRKKGGLQSVGEENKVPFSLKEKAEVGKDRTKYLSEKQAALADKVIQAIIDSGLKNGLSAQEITDQIVARHDFILTEVQAIQQYVAGLVNNTTEQGNSKQSFAAWRRGEFDTTEQQEDSWVEDDSEEDDDLAGTMGIVPPTPKKSEVPQDAELIDNLAEEIQMVKDILGDSELVETYGEEAVLLPISTEVAEAVIRVKMRGNILEGLFAESAIYLRQVGTKGRGYHEAFHKVFTMALSPQEQARLIDELQTELEIPLTGEEAEEILAERFRKYMLTPSEASLPKTTFWDKLKKIFKMLKDLITLHSPEAPVTMGMNELFRDIKVGKFKGHTSFKNKDNAKGVIRSSSIPGHQQDIPHLDLEELQAYQQVFDHVYKGIVSDLKNTEEYKDLTDVQALTKASRKHPGGTVGYLKDRIFRRLRSVRKNLRKEGHDITAITKMIHTYFPPGHWKLIKHPTIAGKHKYIATKKNSFYNTQSLLGLAKYGVVIHPGTDLLVTEHINVDESEDMDLEHTREGFSRTRMTENPRLKSRDSSKRILYSLPIKDHGGNTMPGIMGQPLYHDGLKLFSILEANITNSRSQEKMMNKIKGLTGMYLWAQELYDRLAANDVEKLAFFNALGNPQQRDVRGVSKDGFVFRMNSKAPTMRVRDSLSSYFLTPSSSLLRGTSHAIDIDVAKQLKEGYDDFVQQLEDALPSLMKVDNPRDARITVDVTTKKGIVKQEIAIGDFLDDFLMDYYINIPGETLQGLYAQLGPADFIETILKNDASIGSLIDLIAEGTNPFLNIESDNPGPKMVYHLAEKLHPAWPMQLQSTFMHDNKPHYAINEATYVSQLVDDLTDPKSAEAFIKSLKQGSLAELPLLADDFLGDSKVRDIFSQVTMLSQDTGGSTVEHKKMTPEQYARFIIQMYQNNNNKKVKIFPMIPSESSILDALSLPALTVDAAINAIYRTVIYEAKRINNLNTSEELQALETYGKEGKVSQHFPFLKDFTNIQTREAEIKHKIRVYLEAETAKHAAYYNDLFPGDFDLGLRGEWDTYLNSEDATLERIKVWLNSKGHVSGNLLLDENEKGFVLLPSVEIVNGKKGAPSLDLIPYDKGSTKPGSPIKLTDIASLDAFKGMRYIPKNDLMRNFTYNSFFYGIQLMEIIHGSPAFYGAPNAMIKRGKEGVSPGGTPSTDLIGENRVKVRVRPDSKVITDPAKVARILKRVGQDPVTQALWREVNNLSDGFTYISMPLYRKMVKAHQKWGQNQEKAYDIYMAAYKAWKPGQLFNSGLTFDQEADLFGPIKPFLFSKRKIGNESVPVQMKTSFHVLTPEVINLSQSNADLMEVYDAFNDDVEIFTFDSSMKLDKAKGVVDMVLNFNDIRWQQDNPPHWKNDKVREGSQMRVIMASRLIDDADYVIDANTTMKGKDVRELLFSLWETNLVEDNARLRELIQKDNYEGIRTLVMENAYRKQEPASSIDALSRVMETKDGIIPKLFTSFLEPFSESTISSLIRNNISLQKRSGGQFVNFSSHGLSEDLKLVEDKENNTLHLEAYLPYTHRALYEKHQKDGQLDGRLLELFGYRIPTEARYSIFAIKVKGFLPPSTGGSIVLPEEITKISGLDFDIDKLFLFTPNFDENTDYIQYDYTKGVTEQTGEKSLPRRKRENALIQVLRAIQQQPLHTEEVLGPGNFEKLINTALTHFMQSIQPNKSYAAHLKMSIKDKQAALDKYERENMNLALPLSQIEFFKRIRLGLDLIGIAANHNTNSMKAELTDFGLANAITLNGITSSSLHDASWTAAKKLSEVIAAVVDSVKKPTAPFFNLSPETADVFFLLTRLGHDLDFTTSLLNHPMILEMTKIVGKDSKSSARALNELILKKENILRSAKESIPPAGISNLSLKDLQEKRSTEMDLKILQTYSQLHAIGRELTIVVNGTKQDAAPPKASVDDLIILDLRVKRIKDNGFTYLKGASDFFTDKSRLVNMYQTHTHELALELHKKFFPYLNADFMKMVYKLEETLPFEKQLTARHIKMLRYHWKSYHLSSHPGLVNVGTKDLIETTITQLEGLRKNPPAKYHLFLSSLKINRVAADPRAVIDRIEIDRTTFTSEMTELVRQQFIHMMNSTVKSEKEFANNLYKYAMKTFQHIGTPSSFTEIIHPNMMYNKVGTEVPVENWMEALHNDSYEVDTQHFIDQLLRNTYYRSESPMPRIYKNAGFTTGKGAVVIDHKNPSFHTDQKKKTLVPYVRFYDAREEEKRWRIYRRPDKPNAEGKYFYTEAGRLGIPYYMVEYSPMEMDPTSQFMIVEDASEQYQQETLFPEAFQGALPADLHQEPYPADVNKEGQTEEEVEVTSETAPPWELEEEEAVPSLAEQMITFEEYSAVMAHLKLNLDATETEWNALTALEREQMVHQAKNCKR